MIGWTRTGLVLLCVTIASLIGIPVQIVALRTGIPHPGTIPRLFHGMARRLLGISVRVSGRPAADRPLLLVANHVSWTDIVVLSSLAPMSFVAKSDMADWPVFGLFAKLQRSVFVERNRTRSSRKQANELGDRLAEGTVMVLFAEGTTSDGNIVMPFKSTLFGAAQAALVSDAGKRLEIETVHIQPVTIAYTRLQGMPMGRLHRTHAAWIGESDLVPHLGALIREGAMDVEVHFGEPVPFTVRSKRKNVALEIEAVVRAKMAEILRSPH
ncbi:1-acyl-sn-glycerol-3-phosphate acyltransferase [Aquibium sp. LZ166]|uniref:1-acyl-sn-glycerol-3-phosphate acyltransferase n=1 Tax=Aquibium pacificus TaxID=3153579 RepID=A0ABV3SF12_9HYPH